MDRCLYAGKIQVNLESSSMVGERIILPLQNNWHNTLNFKIKKCR